MITASRSVLRRGAKRFRVEISKTGGGGGGEVVAWGLACVFCCCCTQCPRCPGAGVKDIWEDCVLGAQGLCRETHGVEVVGVLAARCIHSLDSSCTECSLNASSPALKGRHKSAIKASNSETMVICVNKVLAVLASLAAAALAVLTGYKLIVDSGNQNKTSDNKAL